MENTNDESYLLYHWISSAKIKFYVKGEAADAPTSEISVTNNNLYSAC